MKRKLVTTADGSHSLYVPELDEQYHSRHGSVRESEHVFIEMGWKQVAEGRAKVDVLEIGFGTGLNALLTLREALNSGVEVYYEAVDAYPLAEAEAAVLNYAEFVGMVEAERHFSRLHATAWDSPADVAAGFRLHKCKVRLEQFESENRFDLVYFDAFAPNKQPELWTEEIFRKMYAMCRPGAVLTTYCAKGDVRRAMIAAGFTVEKAPGPPGKREMLRAVRS